MQIFLGVKFESQPRKSHEHWKPQNLAMLYECHWRFLGYTWFGMEKKNLFCISPFSTNWIHIFAPKPMTITSFKFNIDYWNWKASLVIVICFGAKICIQLVEKGEIQNKFFFSIPNHVYPRKRQLHLLSIVKFRGFQCSRLFLGLFCNFKFPYMYICTCFGFPWWRRL